MSLLRGAEYRRIHLATRREPLTQYDMNLTAHEHRALFQRDCDEDSAEEASEAGEVGEAEETGEADCSTLTARAWRCRSSAARVRIARRALAAADAEIAAGGEDSAAGALLLLAEEDASTVLEAERALRRAVRAASASASGSGSGSARAGGGREAGLLALARRRLAMCARRLGRLREATRLFRELTREAPPALLAHSPHENLIEVLLEQNAIPDVQVRTFAHYFEVTNSFEGKL